MPYPCPENIKIIKNTPTELILSQEYIYTDSDKYESIFIMLFVLFMWINPFEKKSEEKEDISLLKEIMVICVGLTFSFFFIFGMIEPLLNDKYYNNFKITSQYIEYERIIEYNIFKTEKAKANLKNVKQLFLLQPLKNGEKTLYLYALNDKNEKVDLNFTWGLMRQAFLWAVQKHQ